MGLVYEALLPSTLIPFYSLLKLCIIVVYIVKIRFMMGLNRLCGAMVARRIPNPKVESSILFAVTTLLLSTF